MNFLKGLLTLAGVCVAISLFALLSLKTQLFVATGVIWIFAVWLMGSIKLIWEEIHRLDAAYATLEEFICESDVLKAEVVKFAEHDYVSYHHQYLRYDDALECHCGFLFNRANILKDRKAFNEFYKNRHANEFEPPFDPYDDYLKGQFPKTLRKTVLPLLRKLNHVVPVVLPKEHLKWLMRKGKDRWDYERYMTWLLADLKRKVPMEQQKSKLEEFSSKYYITTEEGRVALREIENTFRPPKKVN